MKRRQPAHLAPHQPAPVAPACDSRLGYGLHAAAVIGRAVICPHRVFDVVEVNAAPAGLLHLLTYYREHCITGDA